MKNRGKGNEWLIIKKRDEFAQEGWDVEAHATSALSGRTQEEIADNLPARKAKAKTAGASDRVWESSRPAKRGVKSAAAPAAKSAPVKKKHIDLSGIKGARQAPLPANVEPMSATLADKPPRGEQWLFEVKWDGVRAIAFIESEEVRLQSRSGLRCERQYPELAVIQHQVAASQAILDGEIAVLDPKGVSQFHLIQPRIANSDPNTIAHLVRSTPVVYFAFDLLYLDGYDLRGVPLAKRRELLEAVVKPGGPAAHFRKLPRRRGRDAGGRAGSRPGRHSGQKRRQHVRIAPQPRVAEDQAGERAGIRDRRIHRAAGRPQPFRRSGSGRAEGRQAAVGGQCRDRFRRSERWPICTPG